jgi:hypothetical protein
MATGQTELIPDGTRVRILRSGYGPAEVVEYRGPFGPGGVPIYRVLVQTKPEEAYIEVRGDQLEVLAAPTATTSAPPSAD